MWGRGCHLFCLCSKLMFFKRSRVYCSKSSYAHQTSQKKLASGLHTDNFTQSLATSTTILQLKVYIVYVMQKISWTLVLAGVSYQFGFVSFPICLQCKISGSSVFFCFFPMKFHIILRKKTDPNFENKFRWAWLRELKSPYGIVLRILTKVLSKKILHRKVPMFFFYFLKK